VIKFTAALNQSNIRVLDFTGNTQLGDTFLASFLFSLRPPHLRELGLSVLGLTPTASQPLSTYLSSPASRPLKILRLNGNTLDLAFIDTLLAVLSAHNFSLVHVEVYANRLNDRPAAALALLPSSLGSSHYSPLAAAPPPLPAAAAAADLSDPSAPSQATPPSPPPTPPTWHEADPLLRALFERNRLYAAMTSRQAIRLLPYARALFLRTNSSPEDREEREQQQQSRTTNVNILDLAVELQVSILHCLVPVLSPAQCHRVCRYVSSVLPPINPSASVLYHH
jgi:hypothetical protein